MQGRLPAAPEEKSGEGAGDTGSQPNRSASWLVGGVSPEPLGPLRPALALTRGETLSASSTRAPSNKPQHPQAFAQVRPSPLIPFPLTRSVLSAFTASWRASSATQPSGRPQGEVLPVSAEPSALTFGGGDGVLLRVSVLCCVSGPPPRL